MMNVRAMAGATVGKWPAMAGGVREANHEVVGLADGWQVAKQLTQQSAQQA
jgi:hypothetical protein